MWCGTSATLSMVTTTHIVESYSAILRLHLCDHHIYLSTSCNRKFKFDFNNQIYHPKKSLLLGETCGIRNILISWFTTFSILSHTVIRNNKFRHSFYITQCQGGGWWNTSSYYSAKSNDGNSSVEPVRPIIWISLCLGTSSNLYRLIVFTIHKMRPYGRL